MQDVVDRLDRIIGEGDEHETTLTNVGFSKPRGVDTETMAGKSVVFSSAQDVCSYRVDERWRSVIE